MTPSKIPLPFQAVCVITSPELADRACTMFQKGAVPVQYQFQAYGTASSEVFDLLGLGSIDKRILVSLIPKVLAEKILEKLRGTLGFGEINTGIAFTVPMSAGSAMLLKAVQKMHDESGQSEKKEEQEYMSDFKYALVTAAVNRGYSEEVMKAARTAGAAGGTVVNSRQIVNEETLSFWGVSLQQEKELVLILTEADKKMDIMRAIGEQCGLRSEARGLVLSVPVDNVIGLGTLEKKPR